jgi:hypothetical protein
MRTFTSLTGRLHGRTKIIVNYTPKLSKGIEEVKKDVKSYAASFKSFVNRKLPKHRQKMALQMEGAP